METSVLRHNRLAGWTFFAVGSLALGGIGGLIGGTSGFDTLQSPPLTPPGWLFPVVWSILYLLMGTAAYLVYLSDSDARGAALKLYTAQLIINVLWPLLFFRLEWRLFALLWLMLLLICVILTTTLFGQIRKAAGWLMAPYIAWCTFAAYLNFGFYVLNK